MRRSWLLITGNRGATVRERRRRTARRNKNERNMMGSWNFRRLAAGRMVDGIPLYTKRGIARDFLVLNYYGSQAYLFVGYVSVRFLLALSVAG